MEFPDGVEIKESGTFRIDDWEKYIGFFKLKAQRELEAEREKVLVLREAATLALSIAESWIHDRLVGTPSLKEELANLQPVREALQATTQNQKGGKT